MPKNNNMKKYIFVVTDLTLLSGALPSSHFFDSIENNSDD